MRNLAQTSVIAVFLLTSVVAGGCVLSDMDGDDNHGAADMRPQRVSTRAHKPTTYLSQKQKSKPDAEVDLSFASVEKPKSKTKPAAATGESLRKFCDQRHIRFQSGKLDESTDEMVANNDRCKQIYETGRADQSAEPNGAGEPAKPR